MTNCPKLETHEVKRIDQSTMIMAVSKGYVIGRVTGSGKDEHWRMEYVETINQQELF